MARFLGKGDATANRTSRRGVIFLLHSRKASKHDFRFLISKLLKGDVSSFFDKRTARSNLKIELRIYGPSQPSIFGLPKFRKYNKDTNLGKNIVRNKAQAS